MNTGSVSVRRECRTSAAPVRCRGTASLCRSCLALNVSHHWLHSWCGLLCSLLRVPFNPLEIEHKDRVENGDEEQGDEGGDGQSADLRVTERLPERTTFESKR